jgi:nucleolar pre-ribosomal-associated protein 2
LQKKTKKKTDSKKKPKLDYAQIALFEALILVFISRSTSLDDLGIITASELEEITTNFKSCLLAQLQQLLQKPKTSSKDKEEAKHLTIVCALNAMASIGVDGTLLAKLVDDVKSFTATLADNELEIGKRLDTFMSIHAQTPMGELLESEITGDMSTIHGRRSIHEQATALIIRMDEPKKLECLKSLIEDSITSSKKLDKMLAARYVITACEGTSSPFILMTKLMTSRFPKY